MASFSGFKNLSLTIQLPKKFKTSSRFYATFYKPSLLKLVTRGFLIDRPFAFQN